MQPDDSTLLRQFSARGDDAAFEEIVRRYAGMVLGTAVRTMSNRQLAEEVSQNVFAILARKAGKLGAAEEPGSLGSWLHRTTLLETRNVLRAERTRIQKMHELERESQARGAGDERSDFSESVDAAIDDLDDQERRLVMLRFFDGHALSEIGEIVGKSENAVQKQMSRILDRLGEMLKRRGVVVSAAALSTALAESFRFEASGAAVTRISSGAKAAAVTKTSTTSTIAMRILESTGFKLSLVGALIIVGFPLGIIVWNETKPKVQGFTWGGGNAAVSRNQDEAALMAKTDAWLVGKGFTLVNDRSSVRSAQSSSAVASAPGKLYVAPGGDYHFFLQDMRGGYRTEFGFYVEVNRREGSRRKIEACQMFLDFQKEIMSQYGEKRIQTSVEGLEEKIAEEKRSEVDWLPWVRR